MTMTWASNKGSPPHYTPIANGVIEHLLEEGYFLTVFWSDNHINGRQVVINVSKRHTTFSEFPGPNLGDVIHGPEHTNLAIISSDGAKWLALDAANPKSLQLISMFFKERGLFHITHER